MKSCVLFLLTSLYANFLWSQATETEWISKAELYYVDKNYKVALPAYQEAYKLNKTNETTIYRILFSNNELKNYNDAINFLSTLPLSTIVNNDNISEEMSYAAKHATVYDKSIKLLKSALGMRPEKTNYISALANVYSKNEKYADAASTFAILDSKTQPDKVDYENWAFSLNELDRYEEAAATGKKGIGLYKDHVPLYTETGYAYKELKQYDNAKEYFTRSLKLDTTRSTTWRYLGEIYKDMGGDKNIDEAIRCFNKVVSMDKATATTYYNLGWCYNETEDFELAESNLRKSAGLDNTSSTTFIELGYAQYKLSNYTDAIINFKKAIELNPETELAHYYAGLTYYMQKDQYNLHREYDKLKSMKSTQAVKLEKYLK